MRAGTVYAQGVVLALALLATGSCLAAEFFEDFGPGWETRWTHSADEKYVGRFVTDTPEGWEGAGLKVGDGPAHDETSWMPVPLLGSGVPILPIKDCCMMQFL
jgi:hypothetical protein